MRKLILTLIMALVATLVTSCAHIQRGGDLRETRDSTYKVRVTMKLDLAPIKEWQAKKEEARRKKQEEERKKKEEEERLKRFPWGLWAQKMNGPIVMLGDLPITLTPAQEFAGFSVFEKTADTAEIGWSGTGWVAAKGPGRSFVMTAGHVCESKDVYPIDILDIDWDNFEFNVVHFDLPIVEKKHVMLSRDGVESVNGSIIRDEDLDDDFNGNDLCMLGVASDLGPAIPVATSEPAYGETCSVVGAPTGLWGGGVAVASEPIFSGRGAVFGTEPDGLAFNGLLAPGNSGSAVTCGGKAVGVISLGSTRFPSLIHAVPYDRIEVFMRKALHRK